MITAVDRVARIAFAVVLLNDAAVAGLFALGLKRPVWR
jgi:hypothetical protein